MAHEMADPTPALDMVVDQVIRPRMAYMSELVAEMLGLPIDDDRVLRCVLSIQSQCHAVDDESGVAKVPARLRRRSGGARSAGRRTSPSSRSAASTRCTSPSERLVPRAVSGGPLDRHQPAPDRAPYRVGAIRRAQLPANRRDVKLDRLVADAETRRDGLVRQPFDQQLEDLDFARGQRFGERARRIVAGRDQDRVGVERCRPGERQRGEFAGDFEGAGRKAAP